MPPVAPATPTTLSASQRLLSVDALRGFDMFWIIGAHAIAKALQRVSDNFVVDAVVVQLSHVKWIGFHCYDLIFPLFLFIVGVSMVFSIEKAREAKQSQLWLRIVRRAVLLYLLGVIYYGGLSNPWPDVQLGGVLQRIALCYLLAASMYLLVRSPVGLLTCCTALLVGYWALLTYVPFPDIQLDVDSVHAIAARIGSDAPSDIAASVTERIRGVYEEGRNLTNYIDFRFLPGRKPQVYYINEGLLSTIPAVALPLFGALAALLLRSQHVGPWKKVAVLCVCSVIAIGLGLAWHAHFPIVKRIWTSSFVLLSSGLSCLLLAVFYAVVDVLKYQRWCQAFVWIGSNAILIYMVAKLVSFERLAELLVGGDVQRIVDHRIGTGFGQLLIALVGLTLAILLARLLYRHRLFVRV